MGPDNLARFMAVNPVLNFPLFINLKITRIRIDVKKKVVLRHESNAQATAVAATWNQSSLTNRYVNYLPFSVTENHVPFSIVIAIHFHG